MQPFFPQRSMTNRPSGGLLSRLFGGRARSIPNMSNVSRMSSMLSNVQNAANPASISSMMTNVQKVLKTAESIGPMVQQYGPVVRNIPAMFKIYKALKSDDTTDDKKENTESAIVSTNKGDSSRIDEFDEFDALETEFIGKPQKGTSKPKLYI